MHLLPQISLHFLLSLSNQDYGRATSLNNIKEYLPAKLSGTRKDPPYKNPVPEDYYLKPNVTKASGQRANATFVILARNGDLKGIMKSMKQLEDRFNRRYNYPYVFLNEESFSDTFKT